jgi:hypothetical protein
MVLAAKGWNLERHPFEHGQYCGKFAAILPNFCHYYEDTFARRMKMSKKGKHGTWNKTKKTSGIPFTLEKLRETADVIKLIKFSN